MGRLTFTTSPFFQSPLRVAYPFDSVYSAGLPFTLMLNPWATQEGLRMASVKEPPLPSVSVVCGS